MPKLKPVASLQSMAMDAYFEFVVEFCNRLSATGGPGRFRSGVYAIRDQIYSRLPNPFLVEFATKFLDKFSLNTRNRLFHEVALEMVMDVKISGLRLKGHNLQYLDPHQEGYRFQTFEELDLTCVVLKNREPMFCFLHEFHLQDLVTFVYPEFCTDDDLKIIGKNCPKLEIVRVTNSDYVTDRGLRSLSPCLNLRVANFRGCCEVSSIGFNCLLSTHDKLEEFHYGYDCYSDVTLIDDKFDLSSGLDLSVKSSSVNRLIFESYENDRPALDVESVVKKFPNLKYLKINCEDTMNLSVLKYHNNLSGLQINYVKGMTEVEEPDLIETWEYIEEIFAFIGPNITTLTLCALRQHFICTQQELNMIFNGCPNLEHLDFDHVSGVYTVPEFKKLKILTPRAPRCVRRPRENYNLEFGRMVNLEVLELPYLGLNSNRIKEIMLDNHKFPKLSVLRMSTWRLRDDVLPEIHRIAKDKNIEFRVDIRDGTPRTDDYPPDSSSDYDGIPDNIEQYKES